MIRQGRDTDAAGIIALITAAWNEYPGCLMIEAENPELAALASDFADAGGRLWVKEHDGAIAGTIATRPAPDGWELCKMYLAPALRGTGLAAEMVSLAENHARAQGARRMELWSDTRFDRAHRFYERQGFVRQGGIRPLFDISNSLEFGYAKPLAGVVVHALDTAAAASAARSLGRLAPALGEAFFQARAGDIAANRVALLVAWHEGIIAGCAMLVLDMARGQIHRAELRHLTVDPAHCHHGIGQALLAAIEAQAASRHRSLLTATSFGAADLYRAAGWTETGRVEGYAKTPEGAPRTAWFFHRHLSEPG
jgi:GNAT superfamily N-acetyltransferase